MTPMAIPRQMGASGPSAAAELGRALLHEADHALLEVLGAEELHRLQQHVVAVAGEVLRLTVADQALHGPYCQRCVAGGIQRPLACQRDRKSTRLNSSH